jgi:hypothetical protein
VESSKQGDGVLTFCFESPASDNYTLVQDGRFKIEVTSGKLVVDSHDTQVPVAQSSGFVFHVERSGNEYNYYFCTAAGTVTEGTISQAAQSYTDYILGSGSPILGTIISTSVAESVFALQLAHTNFPRSSEVTGETYQNEVLTLNGTSYARLYPKLSPVLQEYFGVPQKILSKTKGRELYKSRIGDSCVLLKDSILHESDTVTIGSHGTILRASPMYFDNLSQAYIRFGNTWTAVFVVS